MCYSAQVHAEWKKFVRMFGAKMSVGESYRTFWQRDNERRGAHQDPEGDGARVC